MNLLTLTYSLADQNFNQTKSVGIFNVSTQLLEKLIRRSPFKKLDVLINSTLKDRLCLSPLPTVHCHDEAIKSKFGRIIWDQWGVYDAAKKTGNQWLFLPKGFASFVRPPAFKLAVYIYDTILNFYKVNYPGVMPWYEIEYFTRSLRETFKRSAIIFTDSDFSKNELNHLAASFKLEPPPIITAGVGFNRENGIVSTKRNSLLVLTSAWPHKLTQRAVIFIERWQAQAGFSGNVEFVGGLPAGMHLPLHAGWRQHPRLSETMYRQFLAEARGLIFFSACEGFGMPPVEATIAGTCPVFSDLPVTKEVMGGRGFSFSNDSYESFVQSLNKALNTSETQIQSWAKQLLERHNWDKVVDKIVNGLTQAGG
jgi:hypothetical protein